MESEIAKITARLIELESMRNANYWRARTGKSMHGCRPLPIAFYIERDALTRRLNELKKQQLS